MTAGVKLRLNYYSFHCSLRSILLAALVLLAIVPYCLTNSRAVVSVSDPHFGIETVAQGLKYPTAMAFLNPDEILVLEKDEGKVVRVVNGNISNNTVLSLDIVHPDERGLLGMALQKKSDVIGENEGNEPKYVFLFYSEPANRRNSTQGVSINGT